MPLFANPLIVALFATLLLGASPVLAQPDLSGTAVISEPNGSPGLCISPCYQAEKSFEFFLDGNPTSPGVCGPGENTYLYTITHIGGSPLLPPNPPVILPITRFEVEVANSAGNVASAGFIPGPGVAPSGVLINTIEDVVTWDFLVPPLASGQSSDPLFLCSPLPPGGVFDTVVGIGGAVALDAPGTCVGPSADQCEIELDKTCCIPPPPAPGVDNCQGDVVRLVFEYTGETCLATSNDQGGKAMCSGDLDGDEPVAIAAAGKDDGKLIIVPDSGVFVGDEIALTRSDGKFKASTKFDVSGVGSQSIQLHTSCSKPLSVCDQFGSMRLVELETSQGGIATCADESGATSACAAPGFPPGTACDSRLVEAVFEYSGDACQNPLPNPQGGKASCDGDPAGANDVSVIYTGKDPAKISVSPVSGIDVGDRFRVTATGREDLDSNTPLTLLDAGGVLQRVDLHTSCSKPLALGDVFGSLRLVEFTTKDGGRKALADPDAPIFFDACELPPAPPGPHCTSKIQALTLRYLGGDCASSDNSQEGKATCSGHDPGAGPVSIAATGKDAGKLLPTPEDGIFLGDSVTFTRSDGKELKSSSEFEVSGAGGTQALGIHTSCSKPLDLGDRFGAFEVFAIDRKDGGRVALGGQVEYQYKITNPNVAEVDGVDVQDDRLGPIASGLSIPAGEMVTLFKRATLSETTTNTATATGFSMGLECGEGIDAVTVTVTVTPAPPAPPEAFQCKKPIDALTMLWSGSQDVRVRAYRGAPGSTLLADVDPVALGDEVSVSSFSGSPNDVVWEIFESGTLNKLGESKFHLSCSDAEMNGAEDCGKPQGDGKKNEAGLINDWQLEGIVGAGGALDCTPPAPPSFSAANASLEESAPADAAQACGDGHPVAVLVPLLLWLPLRRLMQMRRMDR